ncbi:MAG: hypothetical protein ACRDN9_21880, partial [Streptosporangiaceae bacterium]
MGSEDASPGHPGLGQAGLEAAARPGASRRRPARPRARLRLLLGGLAALVLLAPLGPGASPAQAGPDGKRQHADEQVESARQDLDESSAALKAASHRLHAAQAKLSAAQEHLGAVRGKLAAARAKDKAMAAKLADAKKAVAAAKKELAGARDNVGAERERIVAFANSNYQHSRLSRLAAVVQ